MSNFELQYSELGGIRSRVQGVGGNLADCATRLRRQASVLNGQSGFGIASVRASISSSASAASTLSSNSYTIAAFLSDLSQSVSDGENKAYSILADRVPEEKKLTDAVVAWTVIPGFLPGILNILGPGANPSNWLQILPTIWQNLIPITFPSIQPGGIQNAIAKWAQDDNAASNPWLKWLWESAGEAGFVGSAISFGKGIYDFLGGGGNIGKTVSEGLKTVWSFGNDVLDFTKAIKTIGKAEEILTPESVRAAWLDKVLGIGPLGTATTGNFFADWAARVGDFGSNFTKSLKDSLDDFVGGSTKSVSKAVTKWGGVLLTGAVNFFDNKEEFGGVTTRGVAETAIETVVDVGTGLLVGAAVTALAPISAPVLAVAVVSAGIVTGANAWVSNATGKDIAEHASDFVFDVLPDIGKKIGDGAKAVGDTVAGWFSKPLFSW